MPLQIFILENEVVKPTTEILLLHPFSEIWDRCAPLTHHAKAIQEFSYIEFMVSPRRSNPFFGYDSDRKEKEIIARVFRGEEYKPDELVTQAMEMYKEFFYEASPGLTYLEDARTAAENTKKFLKDVDLSERTDKGMLILKPRDVTSALKDTGEVMKALAQLENKVHEELFETNKSRANREINEFERRPT